MSERVLAEQTEPSSSVKRPPAPWWRFWGAKGSLTLLDQVTLGGANFLVGILLARQLVPRDYGAYALAYEIFLLVSLVFAALIHEPMLVFGPANYLERFREYLGTLVRFHFLLAAVAGLALGAAAWAIFQLSKDAALSWAFVGAALAVLCVLLFWLVRRACYVTLSPRRAIPGSLVYASVLLGTIFVCYVLHLLSPFLALALMSASGLAACFVLFPRLKPSLRIGPAHPRLPEVARRHWDYGRWALAASAATWVCGSGFLVILGGSRGLADAGRFRALMNFPAPAGQVFAGISLLTLPYVAGFFRDQGLKGIERLCWRLALLYGGGAAVYWVIVVVFRVPIVRMLYAGRYQDVTYLIPWVALGSILRVTTVSQVVVLKAIQVPFLAFVTYAASSVLALAIGFPAIWLYGLRGAVFAYILTSAASVIMGFVLLRHRVRSKMRGLRLGTQDSALTEKGRLASGATDAVP